MHSLSFTTDKLRIWIFLACLVLLAACQSPPPKHTEIALPTSDLDKYLQRQDVLKSIHAWHIQGKIGFTSKDKSQSGQVNWQQNKDDFTLRIANPLGQEAINIKGAKQQVTAKVGKQQYHAGSISQLIEQEFGWHWPKAQVRFWLLGIIETKHKGNFRLNEKGQLVSIEQNKWQINYSNYKAIDNTQHGKIGLPQKIILKKDDFTIRLIINQWDINPPTG